MKLSQLKNIIKESIKKIQLNENIVCSTQTIECPCVNSLPSQQGNCAGSRTNYCNGGYTDDCTCCGEGGAIGPRGIDPMYKKER